MKINEIHVYRVNENRAKKRIYYINTSEIPGEPSRVNISSHVKTCYFLKSKDPHCLSYIIS